MPNSAKTALSLETVQSTLQNGETRASHATVGEAERVLTCTARNGWGQKTGFHVLRTVRVNQYTKERPVESSANSNIKVKNKSHQNM